MKIESICPTCGSVRLTSAHNKPRPRCRKCVYQFRDQSGQKNPFYGKKHSDLSKLKIGKYERTEAQKEQARNSLLVQGNTKAPYEIWVQKYGQEEADKRMDQYRETISACTSGEKNPMYGKPSPIGSGGGWSGWYRGHYFRSILELSYLKHLIDSNIQFENGEVAKHAIQYLFNGVVGNYFCDFVLTDAQCFVEVKPKKLLLNDKNVAKFLSAKNKHGEKFVVITEDDIHVLKDETIDALYQAGEIKWIAKWEKKYHAYFDMRASRGGQNHLSYSTGP